MYKINLQSREGNKSFILYDPVVNNFFSESGERLINSKDLVSAPVNKISANNPGRKTGEVKKLKIQLGLKCNYSCSYCLQSSKIPDASITSIKDAEEFLNRLDTWLQSEPEQIEFWGGEPLVYIKKLKLLAPVLRERFPDSDFLVITNGSLLTNEIVDFFIQYNFNVAVSHDGPAQSLRGEDPLLDPVVEASCRRLVSERPGQFSFNAVLSKQNTDIRAVIRWFSDRFGAEVPFNFEGIVSYYDERMTDSSRLSDQELLQVTEEIGYELGNGNLDYTVFGRKLDLFLEGLDNPVSVDSLYSKCGMDRDDHLAVDLQGNVTTCQNTGASGVHNAGSVYQMDDVQLISSTHFANREHCSQCAMLRICGGSCMYQHGADFSESCRADYAQALGIFKAAVWRVFGRYVTSVESYQPQRIPAIQV